MAKTKAPRLGPARTAYFQQQGGRTDADAGSSTQAPGKKRYLPTTRPKMTIYLLPELRERALDAVDFLSGPPERLTFTSFLERAIDAEVGKLAKRHNGGKPFPKRDGRLRPGSRAT